MNLTILLLSFWLIGIRAKCSLCNRELSSSSALSYLYSAPSYELIVGHFMFGIYVHIHLSYMTVMYIYAVCRVYLFSGAYMAIMCEIDTTVSCAWAHISTSIASYISIQNEISMIYFHNVEAIFAH